MRGACQLTIERAEGPPGLAWSDLVWSGLYLSPARSRTPLPHLRGVGGRRGAKVLHVSGEEGSGALRLVALRAEGGGRRAVGGGRRAVGSGQWAVGSWCAWT